MENILPHLFTRSGSSSSNVDASDTSRFIQPTSIIGSTTAGITVQTSPFDVGRLSKILTAERESLGEHPSDTLSDAERTEMLKFLSVLVLTDVSTAVNDSMDERRADDEAQLEDVAHKTFNEYIEDRVGELITSHLRWGFALPTSHMRKDDNISLAIANFKISLKGDWPKRTRCTPYGTAPWHTGTFMETRFTRHVCWRPPRVNSRIRAPIISRPPGGRLRPTGQPRA